MEGGYDSLPQANCTYGKGGFDLGCNIPCTFQFGDVIPNKLECSTFLYLPLYRCSVALADFRQELECSRITQAHTKEVQLGIHLQHNQNNLYSCVRTCYVCVGAVCGLVVVCVCLM